MVPLVHTLSSTFSRANFLPKPSFTHTIEAFRTTTLKARKLQEPTTLSSINFHSKSIQTRVSAIRDDIVVLGIETSCDDTAAAVVRSNGKILSQVVSSQADLLERYGGVDPKKAGEAHSQVIDEVVQRALDEASLTEKDLSAVAVTIGPGLSLCLRVGIRKARNIAGRFMLPIVGIHHMEAHTLVARLVEKELQFPFLALLISGGHNLLVLARDLGNYVQLGTTIDDAIGEAYDKTARWLGLNLRRGGGVALEELAREGNAESVKFSFWIRCVMEQIMAMGERWGVSSQGSHNQVHKMLFGILNESKEEAQTKLTADQKNYVMEVLTEENGLGRGEMIDALLGLNQGVDEDSQDWDLYDELEDDEEALAALKKNQEMLQKKKTGKANAGKGL